MVAIQDAEALVFEASLGNPARSYHLKEHIHVYQCIDTHIFVGNQSSSYCS